jgi:ATP-dependent DNA helicase RecQ
VAQKIDARRQLLDVIDAHRGESGIVYCLSRRKVEETAAWLAGQGVDAIPYHAGMDAAARSANQRRFLREDGIVMVATIAFGMGIDKPDVRFVAHLDLPKSLEGYYQETGRAGRDGAPAEAWLAYGLGDVVMLRQMIESSESGEERKRVERRKLDALLGYCESTRCRRVQLLAYFGEEYGGAARSQLAGPGAATGAAPMGSADASGTAVGVRDVRGCGNCDNCLAPPETWDGTEAAQKALSVVFRTGQRFGAGHLIDVLRGSAAGRVAELGHDRLPTYGVGADLDATTWRSVFRQLVAAGYLDVDSDGFGTLRLAPAARPVLKGEARVALRRDLAPKRARGARRSRGGDAMADLQAVRTPLDGEALARFERLRAWRSERAREQNLPAYIIFHDATLQDIAAANPQDLDALATIGGVGATKLERYGEDVLAVLLDAPIPLS